uniref:Tubulin/FtsZ GTPase domain-containing protein n=1 Tax=Corethron hystrix TaxID=216773 RepID=A0A7S1B7E8_9STRA|mmetsp:Transcript_15518/g.34901  ORF Transcript_15518/g.34901 Transcript_15518/m.34901 type:complete len:437 (+) Transcript_15518:56-1366(+)
MSYCNLVTPFEIFGRCAEDIIYTDNGSCDSTANTTDTDCSNYNEQADESVNFELLTAATSYTDTINNMYVAKKAERTRSKGLEQLAAATGDTDTIINSGYAVKETKPTRSKEFNAGEKNKKGIKMIKIVGVGGIGREAISRIKEAKQVSSTRIKFCHIDTDEKSMFEKKKVGHVLSISNELTGGKGTNGDPVKGRLCVKDNLEKIKEECNDVDVLIIVTSLNGGTSCGASPAISEFVRAATNCFTIAVVAFPSRTKSILQMNKAIKALENLEKNVDFIVLSHDIKAHKNLPQNQLLEKGALCFLSPFLETSTSLEKMKAHLAKDRFGVLGVGAITNPSKLACKKNLSKNLLTIPTRYAERVIITCSKKDCSQKDIEGIRKSMSKDLNPRTQKIKWRFFDNEYSDKRTLVTYLATAIKEKPSIVMKQMKRSSVCSFI